MYDKAFIKIFKYIAKLLHDFTATSQRPQSQVGDRHQVDDIDSSHSQKGTSTTSPSTAANNVVSASDELGALPSGWQMSKTDNGRVFFIDHAHKRTTWIDPRTGKPSPSPDVQRELNQNGPLP
ncbi:unnamed protein product, partial [Rotaria sp. Silwood1]